MISPARKSQLAAIVLLLILLPLAYWLRFFAPIGDRWRDWTGGAAYVIFWCSLGKLLWPQLRIVRITGLVLAITCCLEFLQLWHPAWLEAIRRTLPGRLVLGTTFDWADFRAYFAGAALNLGIWRLLAGYFGI